jgi:hypothetical protein
MSGMITNDGNRIPSKERQFDVTFFIQNFPAKLTISDENFFTHGVDERSQAVLSQDTHGLIGGDFFQKPGRLTMAGYRLEAASTQDALRFSWGQMEGLIDGFSVILERGSFPKVANLALVIDSAEGTAEWVAYSPIIWAWFGPKETRPGEELGDSQKRVLEQLIPFFDVCSGAHPRHETALAKQLQQSLKMFRHGAQANSFAVEFICKFCAWEGLVCSPGMPKWAQMSSRLPELFRNDPGFSLVRLKQIWKDRGLAVHESAGFHHPVEAHLSEINHLFRANVAFATAYLGECTTVTELWTRAASFQLPAWALERQKASHFMAARDMVSKTGVQVPQFSNLFEACIQAARRKPDPTTQEK